MKIAGSYLDISNITMSNPYLFTIGDIVVNGYEYPDNGQFPQLIIFDAISSTEYEVCRLDEIKIAMNHYNFLIRNNII